MYAFQTYIFPALRLSFDRFSLTLFKRFLAQTNSVASIPIPIGIKTIAGPGNTIIATPIAKTVNPIRTMTSRFALRILLRRDVFMPDKSS